MTLPMTGPTAPSALDPDGIELATVARRWLEARSPSAVVRAALDAEAEVLPPFWDELTGMGWVGLAVPEAAGGQGGTLGDLCTVVEEWGRAVAPGPFPGRRSWPRCWAGSPPTWWRRCWPAAPAAAMVDPSDPVDGGGLAEWFLVPALAAAPASGEWVLVGRDQVRVRAAPRSGPDPAAGRG